MRETHCWEGWVGKLFRLIALETKTKSVPQQKSKFVRKSLQTRVFDTLKHLRRVGSSSKYAKLALPGAAARRWIFSEFPGGEIDSCFWRKHRLGKISAGKTILSPFPVTENVHSVRNDDSKIHCEAWYSDSIFWNWLTTFLN